MSQKLPSFCDADKPRFETFWCRFLISTGEFMPKTCSADEEDCCISTGERAECLAEAETVSMPKKRE